ncbi:M23 family metallopeptidase [Phyllobacterium sp. 0TCS1.6C]|jgi:murein DD-endopeptidase MepM/ murein hydrolase activator NlpD|nr:MULTISPECIES: M23 family metallopeptidase [unclassified Phyllobacterium]MCX8280797.1 M23 family metallopeptidase [Phyllobacterium sp. 0TCS1.6C]MCX8292626.1 M23 family metallopeptidase [Phyllobacterium sp. 0TCS1.6A]
MRLSRLDKASRRLALNAAILTVAGLAAGCSSGVARFSSADFGSGYSDNQRSMMQAQNTAGPRPYTPPVDSTYTASVPQSGGVQRGSLPPVGASSSALPPASAQPSRPALAPVASSAPVRQQQVAAAPMQAAPMGSAAGTLRTPDGGEARMPARAAAQAPKAAAVAGSSYTVQSGDTLHAISRKTGANIDAIKAANNMQDGTVRIGQSLTIPPSNSSLAQNVATNMKPKTAAPAAPAAAPVKVAAAPAVEQAKPAVATTAQPAAAAAPAVAGSSEAAKPYTPPAKAAEGTQEVASAPQAAAGASAKMRWPVRGRVVANYGKGSDGIDISVPEGTPIKAAEGGVVIYSGDGLKEFGNTVLVRHDDGLVTVYGNASKLNVQRGQKVKRGDELGRSGMTGNATTPKLHFEVRKNSTPVDPSKYLEL